MACIARKELERQGRSIIHLELGERIFIRQRRSWMRCAMRWPGGDGYCSRGRAVLREAIAIFEATRRFGSSVTSSGGAGCKWVSLAMMR